MNALEVLNSITAQIDDRREQRRQFLKVAGGGMAAIGGASLLAACGGNNNSNSSPVATTPPPTSTAPTPITDLDILNFALNLEYLEAQFYSFAVNGTGLPGTLLTGQQTQGAVTGGKKVTFTDPIVAAYAKEIAADEAAHVAYLRSVLGNIAVSQPALNIDGGATGAFTAAARAAKVVLPTGPNGTFAATDVFDPYASDEAFLLGAFIFEDVGVTAYKGASPLITNGTYLTAAAGILAAEAYHAGLVRTVLYGKGIQTPSLRINAGKISDARDSLDGSTDMDQGITGSDASVANLVPTDNNSIVYSRTTAQVLNIVFLNNAAVTMGGFFPSGVNGVIRTSGAN